eukprot:scaffold25474_cov87-Phaeocystis_antarctica.AAC.4
MHWCLVLPLARRSASFEGPTGVSREGGVAEAVPERAGERRPRRAARGGDPGPACTTRPTRHVVDLGDGGSGDGGGGDGGGDEDGDDGGDDGEGGAEGGGGERDDGDGVGEGGGGDCGGGDQPRLFGRG